jgi:hypothetical protein
MAINPWVSQQVRSEQNLYEDLVIESLKFYGQDVYYLPREIVNKDKVFLDDVPSRFSDAYKIEMYVENTDAFGGEGDLFTKFGIELRDQVTFIMARKRWKKLIGNRLDELNFRPREGDLIYIPFSQSLFEIFKVETENPFYQLNQLPTFRVTCELFEYNDEDFDTDILGIDQIEVEGAYQYKLPMYSADSATATGTAVLNEFGEVTQIDIENMGYGYASTPTITISDNPGGQSKFGSSSLNVIKGRGLEGNYLYTSTVGLVEMWVYADELPNSGNQQVLFITGGDDDDNGDKRWIWGINHEGKLVYSRVNNGGVTTPSTLTGSNLLFQTGRWHHLAIGVFETNRMVIWFDETPVLDANVAGVTSWDWLSSVGYSIGASAARTASGIRWDAFQGYIDEFQAISGEYDDVTDGRQSEGATNFIPPTEELDSGSNTAALFHFNSRNATATVGVVNNRVTSVVMSDNGLYYDAVPEVTIEAPYTETNYQRGEIVSQDTGEYTMKGEVVAWNPDDDTLYLAHVGSTDGQFRNFKAGFAVVGEESEAGWAPSAVEEDISNVQETAQNVTVFDDFEGDLGDFLDFSESNPFGDME